jgi:hypothetical protein
MSDADDATPLGRRMSPVSTFTRHPIRSAWTG